MSEFFVIWFLLGGMAFLMATVSQAHWILIDAQMDIESFGFFRWFTGFMLGMLAALAFMLIAGPFGFVVALK